MTDNTVSEGEESSPLTDTEEGLLQESTSGRGHILMGRVVANLETLKKKFQHLPQLGRRGRSALAQRLS